MEHRVGILAGHVGKDSGAVDGIGPGDDLVSYEVAISAIVSRLVYAHLTATGIPCQLCIGSLEQRVQTAIDTGCSVALSIHADSLQSAPNVRGYHCMHYPRSREGKRLAVSIDQALSAWPTPRARQVHSRRDLYVLRGTPMPAALVEVGFLSNVAEEAQLHIPEHQEQLAMGITQGVAGWVWGVATSLPRS